MSRFHPVPEANTVVKTLQSLIDMVDGLLGISFTDRDGNPIVTAHSASNSAASQILKSGFLASLTFASEQGTKINSGKCNYVLFEFGSYIIISLFYSKVTAVFVANSDANIGQILDLEEPLAQTAAIFTNMVEQATF